jgi:hypothetical protein
MSGVSGSAVVDAGRRAQRQLVNFGVVSVARVTGEAADRLLELRCECGAAGCCERVQVTRGEYEAAAGVDLLIVSSLHARAAVEQGEGRFAVTEKPPDDRTDGVGGRVAPSSAVSVARGDDVQS